MSNQYEVLGKAPTPEDLKKLSPNEIHLTIKNLNAGYGKMEILHDFDLNVSKAQSLCLIGPNGAGKSTILHSIYGFTNIFSGQIEIDGKEITSLTPAQKLTSCGIAYILQDNSVFPDMTVEENLLMGGYSKENTEESYQEAERIFEKYERLRNRRNQPAKVLSGGERRLLEISRALVMKPSVLLVDEPSIGLEPRYIDMVFEILRDLQQNEKKTIILVEQNAKKGLEFGAFRMQQAQTNAKSMFNQKTDDIGATGEELERAFISANEAKLRVDKRYYQMFEDLRTIGMSDRDIRRVLKQNNIGVISFL